jgi:hypothetical protein
MMARVAHQKQLLFCVGNYFSKEVAERQVQLFLQVQLNFNLPLYTFTTLIVLAFFFIINNRATKMALNHSFNPSFHYSQYKSKYFALIFWKGFVKNMHVASVFL